MPELESKTGPGPGPGPASDWVELDLLQFQVWTEEEPELQPVWSELNHNLRVLSAEIKMNPWIITHSFHSVVVVNPECCGYFGFWSNECFMNIQLFHSLIRLMWSYWLEFIDNLHCKSFINKNTCADHSFHRPLNVLWSQSMKESPRSKKSAVFS